MDPTTEEMSVKKPVASCGTSSISTGISPSSATAVLLQNENRKCGNNKDQNSFAAGMYVTLWPKVEKCHGYVSILLAAQQQLQETIDELLAGLKEAEQLENCSLVSYADRLKAFPQRVEKLQKKLEVIEDRLLTMKDPSYRRSSYVSTYAQEELYFSPLF